jgi:hypothetical protein
MHWVVSIVTTLAAWPTAHAADIEQPIWVAAWGSVAQPTRNVTSMVRLPGDFRPGQANESVNPEEIASQLKSRPEGRRALLLLRYCHSFWGCRGDLIQASDGREYMGPWADAAIVEVGKEWPRFLAMLKYCGGSIDLLVGDFEECGRLGTWWMTDDQMKAVRSDPRWHRRMARTPPLGEVMASLTSLQPGQIKDPRQSAFKTWNLGTKRIAAAYMNQALWEPAVREFPKLVGSNYLGQRMLDRPAADGNGHSQPYDNVFGNAASPPLYGEVGSIVNLFVDPDDPSAIVWSGRTHLKREPWTSLLLCVQQARACARGALDIELMPWIANPSYAGDDPLNPVVPFPLDLRCYDENVRHAALLGVQTFLWWRANGESSAADTSRVDGLVSEINAHTLGRIKAPADVEPISFLSEVVVTGGRRHDGKWLWRVTASPEVATLREAGTGREWTPTADTLGFWVETAEKTAPKWEVARRRGPSEPSLARPVKPAPPP